MSDDTRARLWRVRYKPSSVMRLFPLKQTEFFTTERDARAREYVIRSLGGKVISVREVDVEQPHD